MLTQWRQHIIDIYKKLNITQGGFDITWDDDNLDNQPLILEVSTSFQPNPNVDVEPMGITYGEFKNKIRLINPFQKYLMDIVYKLQKKYITVLIQKIRNT